MLRARKLIGATFVVALAAAACSAAGAARSALPSPRPAAVRASGTVSVFPSPGTPTASPETTISFRGAQPAELAHISVSGSKSGKHTGHVVTHSDGRGASFVPDAAFTEGEYVTVDTRLAVRGGLRGTFGFTIAQSAAGFPANQNPAQATTRTPASQLLTVRVAPRSRGAQGHDRIELGRHRERRHLRDAESGPRPDHLRTVGTDDRRRCGQPRVVRPAARRHCARPLGADVQGTAGAVVVPRRGDYRRDRRGRVRDVRPELPAHRHSARRQRLRRRTSTTSSSRRRTLHSYSRTTRCSPRAR